MDYFKRPREVVREPSYHDEEPPYIFMYLGDSRWIPYPATIQTKLLAALEEMIGDDNILEISVCVSEAHHHVSFARLADDIIHMGQFRLPKGRRQLWLERPVMLTQDQAVVRRYKNKTLSSKGSPHNVPLPLDRVRFGEVVASGMNESVSKYYYKSTPESSPVVLLRHSPGFYARMKMIDNI